LIQEIWSRWKQSSSGALSQALQLAAANEFGGHHRLTAEEVEGAKQTADEFGGMGRLQAYVRAQWEVTQTVMNKSGHDQVEVYRGLMLPGQEVNGTSHEYVGSTGEPIQPTNMRVVDNPPKPGQKVVQFEFAGDKFAVELGANETPEQAMMRRLARGAASGMGKSYGRDVYTKLPALQLQRAGAQSTTSTRQVANDWNGVGIRPEDPTRVVLRIAAPATSILSLPVFGQNAQSEHELVLMGTNDRWYWDAWRTTAPGFGSHPRPRVRKADTHPLVLDLQALDRGQPHWLSDTDFTGVQARAQRQVGRRARRVLKWEEEEHPRNPQGEFTKAGSRGAAIMQHLKDQHPLVAKNYSRSSGTEIGSVAAHTADVLRDWPNQISSKELAGISRRWGSDVGKLMDTTLALHDIGKPDALAEGNKYNSMHTVKILHDVLAKEGFSPKDVALATELINHDLIGRFMIQAGEWGELKGDERTARAHEIADLIRQKAEKVGMDVADFATLQLAFYHTDSGAYPYVRRNFMREDAHGKVSMKRAEWLAPLIALTARKRAIDCQYGRVLRVCR
ncbi:MAG: hypothetical protein C5B54_12525, partial [Acidobacteria bacterium]